MIVNFGELRNRVEVLEALAQELIEQGKAMIEESQEFGQRVAAEISRQAIELGADIANQFAAARAGEMRELTERVAKLEAWQDEMDVLPAEDDEEDKDDMGSAGWRVGGPWIPDGYEDPGPPSVSPLG